uniref:Secreted protein n=1 Tax=Oryza glumipatula TaxID=40148 RepID=A0A0D9ZZW6_9ORYZ
MPCRLMHSSRARATLAARLCVCVFARLPQPTLTTSDRLTFRIPKGQEHTHAQREGHHRGMHGLTQTLSYVVVVAVVLLLGIKQSPLQTS